MLISETSFVKVELSSLLKADDAEERCGLVLASGEIVETSNIAAQPQYSFEIPPEDMVREGVVATWHTHPGQSANLSHEDYAGFLNWPTLEHHIIGTDGVRSYRVVDGLIVAQ